MKPKPLYYVIEDACSNVGWSGPIFHVMRGGEPVRTFSNKRAAETDAGRLNLNVVVRLSTPS